MKVPEQFSLPIPQRIDRNETFHVQVLKMNFNVSIHGFTHEPTRASSDFHCNL